MAGDRLNDLVLLLEQNAPSYTDLSTQLSRVITLLEGRLKKLKVGISGSVHRDADHPTLRYARSGNGWAFWVSDPDNAGKLMLLRDADLDSKIAAAHQLPELLQGMVDTQERRLSQLNDTVPAVAGLLQRLMKSEAKGGK